MEEEREIELIGDTTYNQTFRNLSGTLNEGSNADEKTSNPPQSKSKPAQEQINSFQLLFIHLFISLACSFAVELV